MSMANMTALPVRYLGFVASASVIGCRRKPPAPWGQVKPNHCDSCGQHMPASRGSWVASYEPDGPDSRITLRVCGECAPQLPANLDLLARLQTTLTLRCPRVMLSRLALQISVELGEGST